MKTNRFFNFLVLFFLVAIVAGNTGCSCDDDDDDDDSGSDDDDDSVGDDDDSADDDDDIPAGVFDFMNQDDIDALKDGGMPIYTGDSPPDIEGAYFLNTLTILFYDADPSLEGMPLLNGTITYYDQTGAGTIGADDSAIYSGNVTVSQGFIAGAGNCYTVFMESVGEQMGCAFTAVGAHSGCVTTGGIGDFYWGGIMKEKGDSAGCNLLNPVDSVFVAYESDGLIELQ